MMGVFFFLEVSYWSLYVTPCRAKVPCGVSNCILIVFLTKTFSDTFRRSFSSTCYDETYLYTHIIYIYIYANIVVYKVEEHAKLLVDSNLLGSQVTVGE